jgi:hypothetical protein
MALFYLLTILWTTELKGSEMASRVRLSLMSRLVGFSPTVRLLDNLHIAKYQLEGAKRIALKRTAAALRPNFEESSCSRTALGPLVAVSIDLPVLNSHATG